MLSPQRGTTHWSGLASREPSYIPQCNFCYMIGNPMFREFVLPTLRRDVERLAHSIYHLDGVGELRHLDDVLALEALEAVQWVPGDGQPGAGHWIDVYRRIAAAGKGMWIVGGPKDYLEALDALHGTPYFACSLPESERDFAQTILNAR